MATARRQIVAWESRWYVPVDDTHSIIYGWRMFGQSIDPLHMGDENRVGRNQRRRHGAIFEGLEPEAGANSVAGDRLDAMRHGNLLQTNKNPQRLRVLADWAGAMQATCQISRFWPAREDRANW